jgi:hypothetical protein
MSNIAQLTHSPLTGFQQLYERAALLQPSITEGDIVEIEGNEEEILELAEFQEALLQEQASQIHEVFTICSKEQFLTLINERKEVDRLLSRVKKMRFGVALYWIAAKVFVVLGFLSPRFRSTPDFIKICQEYTDAFLQEIFATHIKGPPNSSELLRLGNSKERLGSEIRRRFWALGTGRSGASNIPQFIEALTKVLEERAELSKKKFDGIESLGKLVETSWDLVSLILAEWNEKVVGEVAAITYQNYMLLQFKSDSNHHAVITNCCYNQESTWEWQISTIPQFFEWLGNSLITSGLYFHFPVDHPIVTARSYDARQFSPMHGLEKAFSALLASKYGHLPPDELSAQIVFERCRQLEKSIWTWWSLSRKKFWYNGVLEGIQKHVGSIDSLKKIWEEKCQWIAGEQWENLIAAIEKYLEEQEDKPFNLSSKELYQWAVKLGARENLTSKIEDICQLLEERKICFLGSGNC